MLLCVLSAEPDYYRSAEDDSGKPRHRENHGSFCLYARHPKQDGTGDRKGRDSLPCATQLITWITRRHTLTTGCNAGEMLRSSCCAFIVVDVRLPNVSESPEVIAVEPYCGASNSRPTRSTTGARTRKQQWRSRLCPPSLPSSSRIKPFRLTRQALPSKSPEPPPALSTSIPATPTS